MNIDRIIYNYFAFIPLTIFIVIAVISDGHAPRNIPIMLGLFALLGIGIISTFRSAQISVLKISTVLYGTLFLLYLSSTVFIFVYHAIRLTWNL